jgi:hypothetical protein
MRRQPRCKLLRRRCERTGRIVWRCGPILEFGEHVLDAVALAVDCLVVCQCMLSAPCWWNAGLDASVEQSLPKPVAVIAAVADQDARGGSASRTRRAPLWSLIWPSLSSRMRGLPSPLQTAWSFEFRPPLVRPIRRGTSPFEEAGCCPGGLQMRCIDHDPVWLSSLARQCREDAAEHAEPAPAD